MPIVTTLLYRAGAAMAIMGMVFATPPVTCQSIIPIGLRHTHMHSLVLRNSWLLGTDVSQNISVRLAKTTKTTGKYCDTNVVLLMRSMISYNHD